MQLRASVIAWALFTVLSWALTYSTPCCLEWYLSWRRFKLMLCMLGISVNAYNATSSTEGKSGSFGFFRTGMDLWFCCAILRTPCQAFTEASPKSFFRPRLSGGGLLLSVNDFHSYAVLRLKLNCFAIAFSERDLARIRSKIRDFCANVYPFWTRLGDIISSVTIYICNSM